MSTIDPALAAARADTRGMEYLVDVVQELSLARDLPTIQQVVRAAARRLTGADGATFVLREGDLCYYADEDAIAPLWKGSRFPASACVSGWVMREGRPAIIPDIRADDRVPLDAYEPTFVRSLVLVPIRASAPIGAIGAYWAAPREASPGEVRLLQALADSTSIAMENVALYADLERRATESARLHRAAEAAVRGRDAFLTVATHELNTPLTALLMHLHGLADRLARPASLDPAELKRKLDATLRGAHRLRDIISNLVDLTCLRAGGLPLEPAPRDLAALAHETAVTFADRAATAGCSLEVDAPRPVVVTVDAGRLAQALGNLINNGLRFAPGAPVRVVVDAQGPPGRRARVQVIDRGPGLPAQVLARLLDGLQGDGASGTNGGLGLGLLIAHGIAREHGGELTASNLPEGGAALGLLLPT